MGKYGSIADFLASATPGKVGKKSRQYEKTGGFNQANQDFDKLVEDLGGTPPKSQGNGIRSTKLPDDTSISVRPDITTDKPTIQIDIPGRKTIKVRYND